MTADLGEYTYDKLLTLTAKYNRKIQNDKLLRLPFLDNATGVAQRPCHLYRHVREREQGFIDRVYQYARHRWKKCKRPSGFRPYDCPSEAWNNVPVGAVSSLSQGGTSRDIEDEDSRGVWAVGVDFDVDSDGSEYMDESYGRRRRKKTRPSKTNRSLGHSTRRRSGYGSNFSNFDEDSNDRPVSVTMFVCEVCGVRYKSRTGLNYHFNSQHPQAVRVGSGRVSTFPDSYGDSTHGAGHHRSNGPVHSSTSVQNHNANSHGSNSSTRSLSPHTSTGSSNAVPASSRSQHGTTHERGSSIVEANCRSELHNSNIPASSYEYDQSCDFCLGDERLNKKTGKAENMLRCSDCDRCAHFSCLQFTSNMITSVRTYRWQCIECKTCWLCGTSENDEQMLFCDDCDRGYHMYCLTPPLSEPPEGSWSCSLCVDHFRSSAACYKKTADDDDDVLSKLVDVDSSSSTASVPSREPDKCTMLPLITLAGNKQPVAP